MPDPDGGLIARMTAEIQKLEFGKERAAELALELIRLNKTILQEAPRLDMMSEPSHFALLLEERAR
jgi:hypothetical protein